MSRRDTSRRKMESRIEEAEGYLTILRARVKRGGAEIQESLESRIRELESWTRSARRRLSGTGGKAAGVRRETLEELSARWERIRGSLDGLISGFKHDETN